MDDKIEHREENHKNKGLFMSYEVIVYIIFFVAVIICVIVFSWEVPDFSTKVPIDAGRWGQLGDFIGGLLGTALTLVSVFLLYRAFKAQRDANDLTMKANKEMVEDNIRHIYWERTKQFDGNFNSLLVLYRETIHGYKYKDVEAGKHSLNQLLSYFLNNSTFNNSESFRKRVDAACRAIFTDLRSSLYLVNTHMRLLYQLLYLLNNSEIDEGEKRIYAKFLRSQLSEMELVLIRYNCWRKVGENLRPLVAQYNIMKHLPLLNLLEFKKYTQQGGGSIPTEYVELVNDELVLWRKEIYRLFEMATTDMKEKSKKRNYGNILKLKFQVSDDCTKYSYELVQTKKEMTGVKDIFAKTISNIPDNELKQFLTEYHKELFELSNFNLWNRGSKPCYHLISIDYPEGVPDEYKHLKFRISSKEPIIISFNQIREPYKSDI